MIFWKRKSEFGNNPKMSYDTADTSRCWRRSGNWGELLSWWFFFPSQRCPLFWFSPLSNKILLYLPPCISNHTLSLCFSSTPLTRSLSRSYSLFLLTMKTLFFHSLFPLFSILPSFLSIVFPFFSSSSLSVLFGFPLSVSHLPTRGVGGVSEGTSRGHERECVVRERNFFFPCLYMCRGRRSTMPFWMALFRALFFCIFSFFV